MLDPAESLRAAYYIFRDLQDDLDAVWCGFSHEVQEQFNRFAFDDAAQGRRAPYLSEGARWYRDLASTAEISPTDLASAFISILELDQQQVMAQAMFEAMSDRSPTK